MAKAQQEKKQTPAQLLLAIHLRELGFAPEPEVRVCAERRWRFDLADISHRLAFEVSGGNWTGGHARGREQEDEYTKLNTAQMLGWKVMQFANRQVLTGEAKEFLRKWL